MSHATLHKGVQDASTDKTDTGCFCDPQQLQRPGVGELVGEYASWYALRIILDISFIVLHSKIEYLCVAEFMC
jgi:hypothetical protein